MRRMLAVAALTTVLALGAFGALGGCGGGGDDISAAARDRLAPMVAHVRSAAEGFDPYGAARAVADVRNTVKQLRADGEIGGLRAQAILAAAAGVERRLALVPTTTTTTTTAPLPAPPQNEDRGKGGGKGKGGKD